MVYYPYMTSIVGKKRGNATYYYLVESARVNGQPRIVSQEYLGTAEELAAAMRGGGLGLPARTQHRHFGAVAAAWGMLEDLGVAGIIDQVTRPRRSDAGAAQAPTWRWPRWAAWSRRAPSWPSPTGGRPPRPAGSPGSARRRWITAGSGTRCTPSAWRSWRRSPGGSRWPSSMRPAWTAPRLPWT